MGIEWTLVNHRNRTMYELGKGPLYEVMRPTSKDAPIFLYRETFVPHFVKFCKEGWSSSFDPTDPQYWTWYWTRYEVGEGIDYNDWLKILNRRSKTSIDISKIDYTWPISRIRKLLIFC